MWQSVALPFRILKITNFGTWEQGFHPTVFSTLTSYDIFASLLEQLDKPASPLGILLVCCPNTWSSLGSIKNSSCATSEKLEWDLSLHTRKIRMRFVHRIHKVLNLHLLNLHKPLKDLRVRRSRGINLAHRLG